MKPETLLSTLEALGVHLTIEGERLRYNGALITPLLQKEIEKNEEALKRLLRGPAKSKPEVPSKEASSIRFYRGISWSKNKALPWSEKKNEAIQKALARIPALKLPRKVSEFSRVAMLAEGKPFFPLSWWLHGVSLPKLFEAEPEARNFPIYEVRGEEVVLVHDPRKTGDCPEDVEHPHRCKFGELVEAQERISGYEWKCRKLKATCPATWQTPKRLKGGEFKSEFSRESEGLSEEGPDDEARKLATRLKRLLEPEALGKLKAVAPIEVRRWKRVLDPETCIKRTLRELETGRSRLLEAAKERARRFLEAVEPLLKEKAPYGAKEGEDENPKACRSYFTAGN